MDRTVADLNIEHFKKLLVTEKDPVKRQTIQQLLAEAKARLATAHTQVVDGKDVPGKP